MLCRNKDKVNFVGGAFSMDMKIYDYNVSSFSYMYIYYLTETKIFDINIHFTKSTVTIVSAKSQISLDIRHVSTHYKASFHHVMAW